MSNLDVFSAMVHLMRERVDRSCADSSEVTCLHSLNASLFGQHLQPLHTRLSSTVLALPLAQQQGRLRVGYIIFLHASTHSCSLSQWTCITCYRKNVRKDGDAWWKICNWWQGRCRLYLFPCVDLSLTVWNS
jgi:hypothetical protein